MLIVASRPVESSVCTVGVMGPSRFADAGMRSRASGAVCLDASFCCFCERTLAIGAEALSH